MCANQCVSNVFVNIFVVPSIIDIYCDVWKMYEKYLLCYKLKTLIRVNKVKK